LALKNTKKGKYLRKHFAEKIMQIEIILLENLGWGGLSFIGDEMKNSGKIYLP
jgi:hypothetical protein